MDVEVVWRMTSGAGGPAETAFSDASAYSSSTLACRNGRGGGRVAFALPHEVARFGLLAG